MNRLTNVVSVLLIITCGCSLPSAAGHKVTAKIEKEQIVVTVNGKLFTCYKFAGSQKYPYFWPVNGPLTGRSITTETSEPYPHHHSLFFGLRPRQRRQLLAGSQRARPDPFARPEDYHRIGAANCLCRHVPLETAGPRACYRRHTANHNLCSKRDAADYRL